jgi:hypothetical protein
LEKQNVKEKSQNPEKKVRNPKSKSLYAPGLYFEKLAAVHNMGLARVHGGGAILASRSMRRMQLLDESTGSTGSAMHLRATPE